MASSNNRRQCARLSLRRYGSVDKRDPVVGKFRFTVTGLYNLRFFMLIHWDPS